MVDLLVNNRKAYKTMSVNENILRTTYWAYCYQTIPRKMM